MPAYLSVPMHRKFSLYVTNSWLFGRRFNKSSDNKTANIIGKNWLVSNSL